MSSTNDVPRKVPPFNPLDKRNLGKSVAAALIKQAVSVLPPKPFVGAGIYAIYYVGPHPFYTKIAQANRGDKFALPIYVGKAVPPGARKGGFGLGEDPGQALYKRLDEHAKSLQLANDLSIDDFWCRYLVVDDIWIPLGESLLIEMYAPLWNRVVDGFGNHDPGSGRYNQRRSAWDSLHRGRLWAERLPASSVSKERIMKRIDDHLKGDDG
ncbi:Eco29kI family restriction endonuclease [Oligosphaera ethanolica]|uniref:Restriction endonuclease n=1 Tax=Oligosphaera ethanolica TaxID=760260 RepID=A0AAE3VIT6_9BACT|nr:Eco29kI family restriction endonuclease [Oligosphaera ethanolica]MDQ0291213.1 hypothetical protein [Oligosphaera ethanolica]